MSSNKNEITLRRVISDLESLKQRIGDVTVLEKVRDDLANVERTDVDALSMKDVHVRIRHLEKVISESATSLTSFLTSQLERPTPSTQLSNSELAPGPTFKRRIEELGIRYSLIEELFGIKGVYIVKDIVTQALTGEKWDIDCLEIVSLHGMIAVHNTLSEFATHIPISVQPHRDMGWCTKTYDVSSRCPLRIVVTYAFQRLEESRSHYESRVSRLTLSDAFERVFDLDFLKTAYNGNVFVTHKHDSIAKKQHTTTRVNAKTKEKYQKLGYLFK